LPLRKKKKFSIDDLVAALVEVATILDTTIVEVSWDANVFGRHNNVPLYFHMSDVGDPTSTRDKDIS